MSELISQIPNGFRSYGLLALFVVGVFGIGSAIGISFMPGTWYDGLAKPWFNPPAWLFGPAWTVLYICIGIAGWRSFAAEAGGTQSMIWFAQMVFNFLWSPVMFGMHLLWPAFGVLALMWIGIAAFIMVAWGNGDRVSAYLFMPYLAWVSFAGLLNVSLAVMNPAS